MPNTAAFDALIDSVYDEPEGYEQDIDALIDQYYDSDAGPGDIDSVIDDAYDVPAADSTGMVPMSAVQESTRVDTAAQEAILKDVAATPPEPAYTPVPGEYPPAGVPMSQVDPRPGPMDLARQTAAGALDLAASPFAVFEAKATRMMQPEPEPPAERSLLEQAFITPAGEAAAAAIFPEHSDRAPGEILGEALLDQLTPDILKLAQGVDVAADKATEAIVKAIGPERTLGATEATREFLTAVRDEIVAGMSKEAEGTLKQHVALDNLDETVFNPAWYMLHGARMLPMIGGFVAANKLGMRAFASKTLMRSLPAHALESGAITAAAATSGLFNSVVEAGNHMIQGIEEGRPRGEVAQETAEVARNAFVISSMLGGGLARSAFRGGTAARVAAAAGESVEEGFQQISSNMAAGKPWHEGIADAMILAIPLGAIESVSMRPTGEAIQSKQAEVQYVDWWDQAPVEAKGLIVELGKLGDKQRQAVLDEMKAKQAELVAEQEAQRKAQEGEEKQRSMDLAQLRQQDVGEQRVERGLTKSTQRSKREAITSELKPVLQPESVRRELPSPIPFRGQEAGPAEVIRPTDEPFALREMELQEGDRFRRGDKEYIVEKLREKSVLAKPIVEAKGGIPARRVPFSYGTKALPVQPAALAELVAREEGGVETVDVPSPRRIRGPELQAEYPSLPDDVVDRLGPIDISDKYHGKGEWRADTGLNIEANEGNVLHEAGHIVDNILTDEQAAEWEEISKSELKTGIHGNKPTKVAEDPYNIWENLYTAFSTYHRAQAGKVLTEREQRSLENNPRAYAFVRDNLSKPVEAPSPIPSREPAPEAPVPVAEGAGAPKRLSELVFGDQVETEEGGVETRPVWERTGEEINAEAPMYHGSVKGVEGPARLSRGDLTVGEGPMAMKGGDIFEGFYLTPDEQYARLYSRGDEGVIQPASLAPGARVLDLSDDIVSQEVLGASALGRSPLSSLAQPSKPFPFQSEWDAWAKDRLQEQRRANGREPLTDAEYEQKVGDEFRPDSEGWNRQGLALKYFEDFVNEQGYDAIRFGRETIALNPDAVQIEGQRPAPSPIPSREPAPEPEARTAPRTGGKVNVGVAGMDNAFEIVTDDGSRISGYLNNHDFPGQPDSPTRGELFYAEVPEFGRRQGMGTKLALDALDIMANEGAETVNMSPTSDEGRALVASLKRQGAISGPIRTSESGKAEYRIGPAELVETEEGGVETVEVDYPRSGDVVDGRTVLEDVPNVGSISASFNEGEYVELPGIREVPVAAFDSKPTDLFYAADDIQRTRALAEEIKASGEISPLIVGVDAEGPYIIEGAHRLGALNLLGAKSFPAVVVQETPSAAEPTPSPIPSRESESPALRNIEGLPEAMLDIVSKATGKQGRFLKSRGMTIEQARELPPAEQQALQVEYDEWLSNPPSIAEYLRANPMSIANVRDELRDSTPRAYSHMFLGGDPILSNKTGMDPDVLFQKMQSAGYDKRLEVTSGDDLVRALTDKARMNAEPGRLPDIGAEGDFGGRDPDTMAIEFSYRQGMEDAQAGRPKSFDAEAASAEGGIPEDMARAYDEGYDSGLYRHALEVADLPGRHIQGKLQAASAAKKVGALQQELDEIDKAGAPPTDPRRSKIKDAIRRILDESQKMPIADMALSDLVDKLAGKIRGRKWRHDPDKHPGLHKLEVLRDESKRLEKGYLDNLIRAADLTSFGEELYKRMSRPRGRQYVTEPWQSAKRIDNVVATYAHETMRSLDVLARMTEEITGEKLPVTRHPKKQFELSETSSIGRAEAAAKDWGDAIKVAGESRSGLTGDEKLLVDEYFFLQSVMSRESKARERFNRLKGLEAQLKELNSQYFGLRKQAKGVGKQMRAKLIAEVEGRRDQVRSQIKFLKKITQSGKEFDPGIVNPYEVTSDEAAADLAEMVDEQTPEAMARLEEARVATAKVWEETLDYLADAGVIAEDEWMYMIESGERHGEYLGPFEVIKYWADRVTGANAPSSLSVYDRDVINNMVGTTDATRDILQSSIDKLSRAYSLGEKNKAMRNLFRMRDLHPALEDVIRPMEPNAKGKLEVPPGFVELHYLDDGQRVTFAVPFPISEAVQSLEAPMVSWMMKALATHNEWLRTGATSLSATFAVANVPRDLITQYVHAEYPLRPWSPTDWFLLTDSFLEALTDMNGSLMMEFRKFGGAYGTFLQQATSKGKVDRIVGKDLSNVFLHPLEATMSGMTRFAQATEYATRLAQYRKTLAKKTAEAGLEKPTEREFQEAALAGLQNSINFRRGGSIFKTLNKFSAFITAGIGGTATTMRGIKNHKARAAMLGTVGITVTAALMMEDADEWGEDYPMLRRRIPEDVLRSRFVKIIGTYVDPKDGKTRPIYIKFPKGDFVSVIAAPVEDFFTYLMTEKGDLWTSLLNMASEASPFPFMRDDHVSPGLVLTRFAPPGLRAVAQHLANKDFYFDQDIESREMQDRYPYLRYDAGTSMGARKFAEFTHWMFPDHPEWTASPKMMDMYARSTLAEFGTMAMRAPELFSEPGEISGRGDLTVTDVKMANRIFGVIPLARAIEWLKLPMEDVRSWSRIPGLKALLSTRARQTEADAYDVLRRVKVKYGSEKFKQDEPVKDAMSKYRAGTLKPEEENKLFTNMTRRQFDTLIREMQKEEKGLNDIVSSMLSNMGIEDGERAWGIVGLMNEIYKTADERELLMMGLVNKGLVGKAPKFKVGVQVLKLWELNHVKGPMKAIKGPKGIADKTMQTLGITK